MERSAFEYLLMHANSLAELGLRQGMAEVVATLEPQAPLAGASSEELEAQQVAQLTAMMQGASGADALDEVLARAGQLAGDAAFHAQIGEEMAAARQAAVADAGQAENPSDDDPDDDMPADLGQYLSTVYATREDLAALAASVMAKVDLEELATLLDCLPADLPPLTAALTAEGLAQWLACYRSEDFALHEIVSSITAQMPFNRRA